VDADVLAVGADLGDRVLDEGTPVSGRQRRSSACWVVSSWKLPGELGQLVVDLQVTDETDPARRLPVTDPTGQLRHLVVRSTRHLSERRASALPSAGSPALNRKADEAPGEVFLLRSMRKCWG
jgi:hypothetical protein